MTSGAANRAGAPLRRGDELAQPPDGDRDREVRRLPAVRALTFDFYETLVHHRTGQGRGAVLVEYLRERGLESDPWEHQVLYDLFERHDVDYSPQLSRDEKRTYVQRLAERLFERLKVGGTSATAADHAVELWRILGPESLAVFPDVHETMVRLRDAGYPLAVVSNWQKGLRHFCAELGLVGFFDHVLASAEVGAAKPGAAIFHEACRRLSVPPEHVLHVGDRVVDDYEGARAAGMQVVLVRRRAAPGTDPEAAPEMTSEPAAEPAFQPGCKPASEASPEAPTIPSLESLIDMLDLA